jgi:phage gpG-like protein
MTVQFKGINELSKYLKTVRNEISNPLKFHKQASVIMLADVQNHFSKEQGPGGKWKSLSPVTIFRRRGGGQSKSAKILQDTGRLRNSIVNDSSSKGAEVGTNVEYAKYHDSDKPRKKLPQRKFLWISQMRIDQILNNVIKFLKKA